VLRSCTVIDYGGNAIHSNVELYLCVVLWVWQSAQGVSKYHRTSRSVFDIEVVATDLMEHPLQTRMCGMYWLRTYYGLQWLVVSHYDELSGVQVGVISMYPLYHCEHLSSDVAVSRLTLS